MKRIRIVSFIMCISILLALSFAVYAHEVPDSSRKGKITMEWKFQGQAVPDGGLTAYRVGQLQEENGNYSWIPLEAYAGFDFSQENIQSAQLAQDLEALVKAQDGIQPSSVQNGIVTFDELELGVYLIVQTKEAEGFEKMDAFLVSVPLWETDHYTYTVTAKGKFQLHQEPEPTAPSKPPEPTLPLTGQLNWPIPVLVTLGLGLFSAGWILRFGKKKDNYEK